MFLVEMVLTSTDNTQSLHGSELFESHHEAISIAMAEMETLPPQIASVKLVASELSHTKFWTRTYVFYKRIRGVWEFIYFYN